jgi:protein TonB
LPRRSSRLVRQPHARGRWGPFVLAVAVQLALTAALVTAFTPGPVRQIAASAITAFDVPPEPRAPPPPPPRHPVVVYQAQAAGAAGAEGRRAQADAVVAAAPVIALAPMPAPSTSADGAAASSGAGNSGQGSGAGAAGQGSGGGGTRLEQIGGTIDSARDYPAAIRAGLVGRTVVVVFTVGTDGRAHDCHVRDSSGVPEADAVTCRLAQERFRFRPATDAAGQPVAAPYGWRQKWHL